jgi:hypothetical protein
MVCWWVLVHFGPYFVGFSSFFQMGKAVICRLGFIVL